MLFTRFISYLQGTKRVVSFPQRENPLRMVPGHLSSMHGACMHYWPRSGEKFPGSGPFRYGTSRLS